MNEKLVRLIVIFVTVILHVIVIFFVAFDSRTVSVETLEDARFMRLIDLQEIQPPPSLPEPEPESEPETEPPQPQPIAEETIAEVMIEIEAEQEAAVAQTIFNGSAEYAQEFFDARQVATLPQFDRQAIAREIIFPPVAFRAGIEGRVLLELFVDRTGLVQRVYVLEEEPAGARFGEAAVLVFTGRQGIPATINGQPVACRFHFPVDFRIR